ncbi:hypothetical protein CUN85_01905 [Methanolobus halotolerans]|uniref:Uncharacterized protein n=1 Tax=Methanolobus halotolerans TaxID=2052935 RepID=A0A4E0PZ60_9EURY|nr:hypothetical protein CUN85_01905 [Methanolobus halotolerans]
MSIVAGDPGYTINHSISAKQAFFVLEECGMFVHADRKSGDRQKYANPVPVSFLMNLLRPPGSGVVPLS